MDSFDNVVAKIKCDFDLIAQKCHKSAKTEDLFLRMLGVFDDDSTKTKKNMKDFVQTVHTHNLKVGILFWANPDLIQTIKTMMKNVYNYSDGFDKFFNDHFTIGEVKDATHLRGYKHFKLNAIEFKELKMKRFDLIVTNPPYDGDLHLQILDELKNISDKVVCVHPARWVEDILAQYKGKNATGRKYEHLKKMLTKVMMITQKDGGKMFNIGLPQDMMIGVYENGKDNGGMIPMYENSDMFFDVLGKIVNYAHNVANLGTKCDDNKIGMSEENKIDGIRVKVNTIIPSSDKDGKNEFGRNRAVSIIDNFVIENGKIENGSNWWEFGNANQYTKGITHKDIPVSIKFLNNSEANTFIDLYRTNVVKNIIHMLKYDQNAGHTHIPYFDPKTIKTKDDVLDALGITNEDHRKWLKRTVDDYREKDFIKYGKWIDC